jgi:hypothetical protein
VSQQRRSLLTLTIGCHSFPLLAAIAQLAANPALNDALAPAATITVDTAKYVVPLNAQQQEGWVAKVHHAHGCHVAAWRSMGHPLYVLAFVVLG